MEHANERVFTFSFYMIQTFESGEFASIRSSPNFSQTFGIAIPHKSSGPFIVTVERKPACKGKCEKLSRRGCLALDRCVRLPTGTVDAGHGADQ